MGKVIAFPTHRIQPVATATAPQLTPVAEAPAPYVYETTADRAKKIRQSLKTTFPGVKFSVRSSDYSMGSSINISWTDGPTETRVKPIAEQHEEIRRDHFGEILSGGNRFVFCNRDYSQELEVKAMNLAVEKRGIPFKVAADLLDHDDYLTFRRVLFEMEG
jgi:hypothetical protein